MPSLFSRAFVSSAAVVCGLTLLAGTPLCAADLDPAAVVTQADVEKVLGGKWTSRSPEPGVLFYEEEGSGYRSVHVYLSPADGRSVAALSAELAQQGEPVEEVAGVGEAAIYRPQSREATTEKKSRSGEILWLSISVLEAASPADASRFAVELAKRGAARI